MVGVASVAAGTIDGNPADAGTADTGAADASTADTGAADTGTADTGNPDTGTAETGVPNVYDAWFIFFAPAEKPVVAGAVVVENQLNGFGGAIAAPSRLAL